MIASITHWQMWRVFIYLRPPPPSGCTSWELINSSRRGIHLNWSRNETHSANWIPTSRGLRQGGKGGGGGGGGEAVVVKNEHAVWVRCGMNTNVHIPAKKKEREREELEQEKQRNGLTGSRSQFRLMWFLTKLLFTGTSGFFLALKKSHHSIKS